MKRIDGKPPLRTPRAYVYNYSRVGDVSRERIDPKVRERLRAIHDTSNELMIAIFKYEGVPVMSTMKLPAKAKWTKGIHGFEWDDFTAHSDLHPSEEMWSVFNKLKHPQRLSTRPRDRRFGAFLLPGDPDEMITAIWRNHPDSPHQGETVKEYYARGGVKKVLPPHPVNLGENAVMAYGVIGMHAHNHPWRRYLKPPDKAGPLEPPTRTDTEF